MSLLLDALKKAADDKKKNLDEVVPPEKIADSDESLELDLDMEPTVVTNDDENFPEVDESSISKSIDEPAQMPPHDELPTQKPAIVIDEDIFEDSKITEEPADLSLSEKNIDDSPEVAKIINRAPIEEPKVEVEPEPELHETMGLAKETADSKFTKKIETEQALSALINKSNQHSRQENRRQIIGISFLAILLLIGSGLYFYIQMSTESQQIFITDNNQASINRNAEITTVIAEKSALQKPEPVTIKKISNTIKTPVSKNVSVNSKYANSSSSIKIVHSQKTDPVNALIRDAYNEFYRENYNQAYNLYNQVILRESNNRDALLGLSAIAVKQHRYEYARQNYQTLLKLNPRDSIAIAGINSLQNTLDSQLNESQLKFMLKDKPNSAHLYFTLGSLYSSQNKWPEAQAAYFSAWSAENKNADFAFNLAVSLDHLNKNNEALNFYTLSLKLKQASNGNFSSESALERINTLRENSK